MDDGVGVELAEVVLWRVCGSRGAKIWTAVITVFDPSDRERERAGLSECDDVMHQQRAHVSRSREQQAAASRLH